MGPQSSYVVTDRSLLRDIDQLDNQVLSYSVRSKEKMATEGSNQERMQNFVVALSLFSQVGLVLLMPSIICYTIFATKYWWIWVIYYAWILIFDNDASVTGRKRSEGARSCYWWVHARRYYPVRSVKLPWGELDKKRNYLFCSFPHGLLAAGTFLSTCTNYSDFKEHFPDHKTHIHSLKLIFRIPILREMSLAVGVLDPSKEALRHVLSAETGGNISALIVGGAQEAYFCNPGDHRIVLKNRKGFVRIALETGAPLVPVYVFGENELFSQKELDASSLLHKLREVVRRTLGISLIFPQGRKDMLGLLPKKIPLTLVVGEPIDVQKVENPTQEQVDHLHQLFQHKLVELFDSQKKNYLKNHETANLEIC